MSAVYSEPRFMSDIAYQYVRREIAAKQYWSHILRGLDFSEFCKGCPSRNEKLRDALDRTFWEMDALDRNDRFWAGTNKLATIHKLSEFIDYQFQKNKDARYVWASIALSFLFGWQQLLSAGKWLRACNDLDLEFLVKGSLNSASYFYSNPDMLSKDFSKMI